LRVVFSWARETARAEAIEAARARADGEKKKKKRCRFARAHALPHAHTPSPHANQVDELLDAASLVARGEAGPVDDGGAFFLEAE
jgi:hypothetical protein